MVLLHGWTATADLNWGRCYAALGEQYEVIAPDLRGHGGGVRGQFSLEACADDTAALLTALGKGPAILVGYSLGGPVATLVWRRHPELVTGLVLCSTAAYFAGTSFMDTNVRPSFFSAWIVSGFSERLYFPALSTK